MAKTAVFLATGFEEIEALTVVDLLRRAGLDCLMVSVDDAPAVTGSHGIEVTADIGMGALDFDQLDMIILPGGKPGTENLKACDKLKEKILEFDKAGRLLSAICAAPTVYGEMGLLKGRKACCYPGLENLLEGADATMDEVTVDGHFTTSRGMGTAIPFGLKIIERLIDGKTAEDMAERIVYGH